MSTAMGYSESSPSAAAILAPSRSCQTAASALLKRGGQSWEKEEKHAWGRPHQFTGAAPRPLAALRRPKPAFLWSGLVKSRPLPICHWSSERDLTSLSLGEGEESGSQPCPSDQD